MLLEKVFYKRVRQLNLIIFRIGRGSDALYQWRTVLYYFTLQG